jgi:hypothetical protein
VSQIASTIAGWSSATRQVIRCGGADSLDTASLVRVIRDARFRGSPGARFLP